ncbi:MAG: guanylate kinase [Gemmatimonadales bacterium]|nr:guanylate kinase [Gemmatimonadales bacterium]
MIVLITGPSGAGKSTFVGKLMAEDSRLAFSVSTTTRPIREGEVDGRDYDFTNETEFLRLKDEGAFVEWARVHDNYYATRRSQLDEMAAAGKIPVLDIDVQGGVQVIDIFGTELVSVFLFPPSWQELERRLVNRGTDADEVIARRLANARGEVEFADRYRYWIINEDVEKAVIRMRAVIQAEECRRESFEQFPL